ncbi:hypothetical protein BUV99_13925, partial [Corynebacterium diphtheriae]
DTWTDFNAVEGDTIDVSALLSDQAVDASNLGNYITLEQRGDTWTDFNAVEGDTIDVSALLSDQAVDASNLGN